MLHLRRLLLLLLLVVVAALAAKPSNDDPDEENDFNGEEDFEEDFEEADAEEAEKADRKDAKKKAPKDAKRTKDAKDTKGAKGAKGAKGTKDAKGTKSTKEIKEPKTRRDVKVIYEKPLKYLVTEEVYLDVTVGESDEKNRIVIGCFGEVTPITCLNFVALAKGYQKGRDLLHYKDTPIHRIIKDFVLQMGDVTQKNGKGGLSIFGKKFEDENFKLSHKGIGWVSMANSGRNTNNSQFFILLQRARWLDGKHVVFGKVVKGMDFVRRLALLDTNLAGKPKTKVHIVDSGVVETKKYEIPEADIESENDISDS